jgi:hypothetical protein
MSNSTISGAGDAGVLVTDESYLDATATLFDGNAIAIDLARKTGSWVKAHVSDCTIVEAAYGLRVVGSGDSLIAVEDCDLATSKIGLHLERAAVLVDGVSIDADLVGIVASTGTVGQVTNSAVRDASLYGLIAFDETGLDIFWTSFPPKGRSSNAVFTDMRRASPRRSSRFTVG